MSKARSLPLGIDIGTRRIRIAEVTHTDGEFTLARVSTLDLPDDPDASVIEEMLRATLRDLRIRERRCVVSVADPEAMLRSATFPRLSTREREQAGRFEASRHIDYPLAEAFVRTIALGENLTSCAIGIVQREVMRSRLRDVRAAGLRPIALDHAAYAYHRALPFADAVLDVGHTTARLYRYGGTVPIGRSFPGGGRAFTHAIANDLSTEFADAERRKCSIGPAGAAEDHQQSFCAEIARELAHLSSPDLPPLRRLTLVGNGARLPGLPERLEHDLGCAVDLTTRLTIDSAAYPQDVLRAAAPDWTLSLGLALWSKDPTT